MFAFFNFAVEQQQIAEQYHESIMRRHAWSQASSTSGLYVSPWSVCGLWLASGDHQPSCLLERLRQMIHRFEFPSFRPPVQMLLLCCCLDCKIQEYAVRGVSRVLGFSLALPRIGE